MKNFKVNLPVLQNDSRKEGNLIVRNWGDVDYIENHDPLEHIRYSLVKLSNIMDNQYYKCKVESNAFYSELDNSKKVECTINGIPSNVNIPFKLDTSNYIDCTISTYEIIEIMSNGFNVKLRDVDDVQRLYDNLKNFMAKYKRLSAGSYNSFSINTDIIDTIESIIERLIGNYSNIITYKDEQDYINRMEAKRNSNSLLDRLEVLHYDLKVDNTEVFDEDISDDEKTQMSQILDDISYYAK